MSKNRIELGLKLDSLWNNIKGIHDIRVVEVSNDYGIRGIKYPYIRIYITLDNLDVQFNIYEYYNNNVYRVLNKHIGETIRAFISPYRDAYDIPQIHITLID